MQSRPFLLLCATGLVAIFSSTISKSPVLPLFVQHLGAGPADVGVVAAISAFAGVLCSIPAGLLADRFGGRRLVLIASVVFATAPFLYLVVTKLWQLVLIRLYHGIATAIFVPVAMALVAGLSSRERGEKLGWFSSATLAGRFMAPLAGGLILGLAAQRADAGFAMVYGVCAAAGVLALLLASMLPATEETCRQGRSWGETFQAFRSVLRERQILLTCLVEGAILFAYGTFETFLPLHAVKNGVAAPQIGVLLSGQVLVLALSKPVMGRFSDLHGRRPQIVAGGMLAAASLGGVAIAVSFWSLFFLSLVFGLCLSVVMAATSAYIADLSSREARGSAMGLLGSVMDIGHGAGPLCSGIVAALFGYGPAFLAAALFLLAMVMIFLLRRH